MGIDAAYGIGSLKQGVCTSSTRPASPFEGQMVYETDTDMVVVWNGSAWRYIAATTPTNGTVLQIVNATTSTQLSTASTTGQDTGLTATITPKSSSSKVLVSVFQNGVYTNGVTGMQLNLLKNGSQYQKLGGRLGGDTISNVFSIGTVGGQYLDSPATTSAVTYKTQYLSESGTTTVFVQVYNAVSTMTLMEVAG